MLPPRVSFILQSLMWSIVVAVPCLVVMTIATLLTVSGGDDSPPSSDTADRIMLTLWVGVSLLSGFAIALRQSRKKG